MWKTDPPCKFTEINSQENIFQMFKGTVVNRAFAWKVNLNNAYSPLNLYKEYIKFHGELCLPYSCNACFCNHIEEFIV